MRRRLARLRRLVAPIMTGSDKWSETVLMWERSSAAISESCRRGWEWRRAPAGSNEPEPLIGHRATSAYHDVVIIEMRKDPLRAIGVRFALADWGKHGARPLRGPIEGSPDVVLTRVMDWPEDVER